MTFKCLAAAGVGLVLTATVAHADTQIITAKAGRSTLIGVSGDIDPVTCKAADGINRFVVLTLPANGSVTTALQKVPYKGGGAAASCEGKPYNANVLLYMPNKGFKGRDSLSVGARSLSSRPRTDHPGDHRDRREVERCRISVDAAGPPRNSGILTKLPGFLSGPRNSRVIN